MKYNMLYIIIIGIIIVVSILIYLFTKSSALSVVDIALAKGSITPLPELFYNIERFNNLNDVRNNIYEYISIYYPSINVHQIEQNINDYKDESVTHNSNTIQLTHKKLITNPQLLQDILIQDKNNIIIQKILTLLTIYEVLFSLNNDDNDMLIVATIGYVNLVNFGNQLENTQNVENIIYNFVSHYKMDNGIFKIYGPDTPNNKNTDEVKIDNIAHLLSKVTGSDIDCRTKNTCYIELADLKKEFIKSIQQTKTNSEIKSLLKIGLDDISQYIYALINFCII